MNGWGKNRIKRFWLGLFGLFLLLLVWVNQTVRSTQISYQIQKLEEQIKDEEDHKSELEANKNQYLSLNSIEEIARQKLGLVNPQDKDIVVIRQ